ncbi:hypothetical protein [Endozoicomonas sp. OPT23]
MGCSPSDFRNQYVCA